MIKFQVKRQDSKWKYNYKKVDEISKENIQKLDEAREIIYDLGKFKKENKYQEESKEQK